MAVMTTNRNPTRAVRVGTVTLGGGMTFDEGLTYELETVVELAGTPDFAEGVEAFLAKRPPNWKAQ